MNILVFAEQRNGILKKSALEALTLASKLSEQNAAKVSAVVIGPNGAKLSADLKGYGADNVYLIDTAEYANYNVLNFAAALSEAIKTSKAELVLGVATPLGKDLFPRVAARFGAGLITDAVDLKLDGTSVLATKPMFAGKVLADLAITSGSIKFATIRANIFEAKSSGTGSANTETIAVPAVAGSRLVTKEIRKGKSEKPDLTEASMIISGGRSLASAENFKILFDCADVIGASVGASRAAVDAGFASHDMQVGQTGKTVNPNLYIACGLSGSIQHMAGMRTSKVIVAVNTDPEAPIFSIADYGIVADLFKVVPVMTEKFKAMDL